MQQIYNNSTIQIQRLYPTRTTHVQTYNKHIYKALPTNISYIIPNIYTIYTNTRPIYNRRTNKYTPLVQYMNRKYIQTIYNTYIKHVGTNILNIYNEISTNVANIYNKYTTHTANVQHMNKLNTKPYTKHIQHMHKQNTKHIFNIHQTHTTQMQPHILIFDPCLTTVI